jgi:ParB family chromosome partitioning protein
MADDGRSRLGRGLAALMGDVGEETRPGAAAPAAPDRSKAQRRVPIELLKPNPRNPRRNFSDADLDELAGSVRERGVIQPIVTRPVPGSADSFEIIAGERRWRAAQRAGLHDVPIIVVEASDAEALELAIIENVQRADLNAVEEAEGYRALIDEFNHTHDDLARIVGKSRTHVSNTMRLLKLSNLVQQYVRSGKITAGHARMLVGQPNAVEIAEDIIARGLNVRQVEAMARKDGQKQAREVRGPKRRGGKDADTVALEKRISDALGLQVSVDHRNGWGVLHIHYSNLEQLDAVLHKLEK